MVSSSISNYPYGRYWTQVCADRRECTENRNFHLFFYHLYLNCFLLYLYKYKIEPRYALIKGDVPADSLASFINAQIYPAFRFQSKKNSHSWSKLHWLQKYQNLLFPVGRMPSGCAANGKGLALSRSILNDYCCTQTSSRTQSRLGKPSSTKSDVF